MKISGRSGTRELLKKFMEDESESIQEYINVVNRFLTDSVENISYLSVDNKLMQRLPELFGTRFRVVDLKNDMTPLKPFSGIIKDMNLPDSEIEARMYFLQKDAFSSYLLEGRCRERIDLISEQEFHYEKTLMQDSVSEMVSRNLKTDYLFINAQYMFDEGFEILKKVETLGTEGKLVFCFDSVRSGLVSPSVTSFLGYIGKRKNFLHVAKDEEHLFVPEETGLLPEGSYGHSDVYKEITDFDVICDSLKNFRLMLAYEQALSFCSWVKEHMRLLPFSPLQKIMLYKEISQIQNEAGNPDEAVLYLNKIIDYQKNDDMETWAFFYMAWVFTKKKSNSMARKYALLAQKRLSVDEESPLYALSLMIEYYVMDKTASSDIIQKYMAALEKLENAGLYNNYVATAVKLPWELYGKKDEQEKVFAILDRCFSYSTLLGNKHLYSSACHWKAIVLSHCGDIKETMGYYEVADKLRTEIGEVGPLLAIRNGLSYELLNSALYIKAYDTVNAVAEKLYQVKDFSSVIDTLKNLGYAIFFARHFDKADGIFSMILRLLDMFHLTNSANNSFLPSVNDILMYRSLVSLDRGDFMQARTNCLTIARNNMYMASVDSPLLHLVKAVLLAQEKKTEAAFNEFSIGIKEFEDANEHQEHKIVFMYFEFSKYLKRLGMEKESAEYLSKGFSMAERHGFSYYTKKKPSMTVDEYIAGREMIEPLKIRLDLLFEKAEKDKLLDMLHGRILEYRFLNKIRSYSVESSEIEKYLGKVCSAIFEHTMADGIFFAEKVDNEWKELYSANESTDGFASKDLFAKHSEKILRLKNSQLVFDKESGMYFSNISKYDFTGGLIIIAENASILDSEAQEILNIALTNIQAQIVMVRQNEHLLFVSTTDQLTRLKNRHSLQAYLFSESERIANTLERKNELLKYTVAFMDMDRFKFYNDTYGHNAGDFLLSCFASLLKSEARKNDFVARYGGDEFVIVMADTDEKEAETFRKRIWNGLQKENFFVPKLKSFLNVEKLDITEEQFLGFSMGLCSNCDVEDHSDLVSVMDNADKALYHVKENSKGGIAYWKNIRKKS